MKNFKNVLAFSLIAVASGISTAQTYTATAGTNGVTDIQSDYSMSTGDGASVSVDVPLEFELPKKVAIGLPPNGTITFPAGSMFEGVTSTTGWLSDRSKVLNTTPHTSYPAITQQWIGYTGAIYANTAISITADTSDFIHETDPNSSFKGRWYFLTHDKADYNNRYVNVVDNTNDSSAGSAFPHTHTIDDTQLMASENVIGFFQHAYIYTDTIDATRSEAHV